MQRWAFARVDLGMGLKEFMRMCPRQFEALRTRYRAKIEEGSYHFELMMAQQAALTFNTRMTFAKQPAPLSQFMPSRWGKDQAAERKKRRYSRNRKTGMTPVQEQFATIMKMHGVKPT